MFYTLSVHFVHTRLHVFMILGAHTTAYPQVEDNIQGGVRSLLLPCASKNGTWGNQAPWQPLLPAEQSGWPRTIFIDGTWTQWVLLSAEGPEMDFAWVRKDSCTTELGMCRFCLLTWGVLIYATLILAFLVFLEQTSPRTLGIIVLAKACVRRWSTHGLARATTECTLSRRTSPYL